MKKEDLSGYSVRMQAVRADEGEEVDAAALISMVAISGPEGSIPPCPIALRCVALAAPRPIGRGAGGGKLREGKSAVPLPPPSSKTFLSTAIS